MMLHRGLLSSFFMWAWLAAMGGGTCRATPPTPPPPATLAQALAAARAPEGGVALTVGAETVTLPSDSTLPPDGSSVDECASAFGLISSEFGPVTALAPADMALLNDSPGDPDLAAETNTFYALKELLASLDDAQWQAITSDGGLGMSDLTDADQTRLFWALFPHRALLAAPAHDDGTAPTPAETTDLSADIPQARLRLSQTARLEPPSVGGSLVFSQASPYPAGTTHYVVVHPPQPPRSQVDGQTVRAVVPNAPKTGDLDFDQDALQAPVTLSSVKTVGDLVSQVAQTSHLELYADPHYAARTVMFVGSAQDAPGGELLQALCLCVTGTFRKVGPAYVLTDDLTGVAVVRQIWAEYTAQVDDLRDRPFQQAEAVLSTRRSAFTLPTFGDSIAATPAQEQPKPGTGDALFFPELPDSPSVPYAQLTPAQQQAAQRLVVEYNAGHAAQIAQDPTQAATRDGNWRIEPVYRLEAMLPSLPQPVRLSQMPLGILTIPPNDVFQKAMKAEEQWEQAQAAAKAGKDGHPPPSLAGALAQARHRAVLAAPRDADEVQSVVRAMRKLGLNELWLPVFQGGVARVPGTALSDPDDPADLLATALAATRGTGITVFPVLDLLTWGQTVPVAAQDVGVLGENSAQIAARVKRDDLFDLTQNAVPPSGQSVSPFAPLVTEDLTTLAQAVAARPGLGGLVWRDTLPDGYDTIGDWSGLDSALGYTPAARLAFLRQFHADPWDIPGGYTNLNLSLPCWDDAAADTSLMADWRRFRSDTDRTLLRSLYATAQASAPARALPILVEQTRNADSQDWFGTWDDPRRAPPTLHEDSAEGGDGDTLSTLSAPAQAKAESRAALAVVTVGPDDTAAAIALQVQTALKSTAWDGLALDVTETDGGPGVAGLRRLAGF